MERKTRNMRTSDTDRLAGLAEVASRRAPDLVDRVLEVMREVLGMEASYVSELVEGHMRLRKTSGAGSFGLQEGDSLPLEETFCQQMVAGRLPNVVTDAKNEARTRDLGVRHEADIGSYVGVPLKLSDGRLYGTLCAVSHAPDPSLQQRDAQFVRVLARLVSEQIEREELEARSRRLAVESTGLRALLAALEARDGYVCDRSRSVFGLASEVAQRMGLSREQTSAVQQAALLHDIGKVAVPDRILNKRGALDEDERAVMREHPVTGARIVASVPGLAHLAPIIRATHEQWDGEGYPDGLAGEAIPLASRIIHACNAWYAMTSDRPYREALNVAEAVRELKGKAGRQFCPRTLLPLADVLATRHLLPPDETERIIDAALRSNPATEL